MGCRSFISAAILCLLAISSSFAGQNKPAKPKPDFTGEWLLDLKKSDKSDIPMRPDLPLKISHHDPELRITQTSEVNGKTAEREFIYFTDERGETNQATRLMTTNPEWARPSDVEKQVTKSRTRWSDDKIITVATLWLTATGSMLEYEIVDEWKLSRDGKVLTKISRTVFKRSDAVFVPAIVPGTKKVYNRT